MYYGGIKTAVMTSNLNTNNCYTKQGTPYSVEGININGGAYTTSGNQK